MSTVTLRKQGNSVGLTLPADTRTRLGLEVGQSMTVVELSDGIKLVPYNPELERQLDIARKVLREQAGVLRGAREALSEPVFLQRDVILFLHDVSLRQYGGAHGVRDELLLQSALDRPENKWAYADGGQPDLFDLAAAYAFGLAKNHAFNDGNKRTAWSSCLAFLIRNDTDVVASEIDAILQMIRLATNELDEPGFAAWLRSLPRR